jgi:hypothetical protein
LTKYRFCGIFCFMPKLVETFVDELDLQGQTETRQFQIVTNAIKHAGLFPEGLIYCGIEGEPYRQRPRTVTPRDSTFGYTYDEYQKMAELIDRLGPMASESTPTGYAFHWKHHDPALITYDADMLMPDPRGPDMWLARQPGSSIESAARLIMYFTRET